MLCIVEINCILFYSVLYFQTYQPSADSGGGAPSERERERERERDPVEMRLQKLLKFLISMSFRGFRPQGPAPLTYIPGSTPVNYFEISKVFEYSSNLLRMCCLQLYKCVLREEAKELRVINNARKM